MIGWAWRWRKALSAFLVILTGLMYPLVTAGAAHAAGPSVSDVEASATKVQKLVTVQKDGTFSLDQQRAAGLLSRNDLSALNTSMQFINNQIMQGNLVSHSDLSVTIKETGTSVFEGTDVAVMGGGVTRFEIFWWGYKLYLSSFTCFDIAAALAVGAGTAQIVAALAAHFSWNLPGAIAAIISSVAQGIMWIGTGVFAFYGNRSGVVIRFAWPAVPTGWWGQ